MNIKINYRNVDELEEFSSVKDEPKIIKRNEVPMLFVQCEGIVNEWYIPLCNVLWWEIDYGTKNISR